jgi:hypothetical protein
LRDRAFAERLRREPAAVLAEYDLTDTERAAIEQGSRQLDGPASLEDRPRSAWRLM